MRAKPVLHHLSRLIGLTPLLLSFCIPALTDTEVGGVIDEDTTWGPPDDTVYIVVETVIVQYGATLTILPGVTVTFDPSTWLSVSGVLAAEGTPEDTILFTSNCVQPAPGDWRAIRFENLAASESSISYATIEYGGAGAYLDYVDQGALVSCDRGASPEFAHCVFRQSAGTGFAVGLADTSSPARYEVTIDSCEFADNAGYPIAASPCGVPTVLSSVFAGNGEDAILVVGWDDYRTSGIVGDTTWDDPGVPYHVVNYATGGYGYGGVWVACDDGPQPTLTIQPGCVLKFGRAEGVDLCAGIFATPGLPPRPLLSGAIVAEGTADDPVTFTTIEEEPETGCYVFVAGVDREEWDLPSVFRHCVFENVSEPAYEDYFREGVACWYNRKVTFEDCVFRPVPNGLALFIYKGAADVIGCTFEYCGWGAIVSGGSEGLIASNTFLGGGRGILGYAALGETITDNNFLGTADYPISFWPGRCNPTIYDNTYVDCVHQAIAVGATRFGLWGVRRDATWKKDAVAYEVIPCSYNNEWSYELGVLGSATLTIEPGVEVRFLGGTRLRVGDPESSTPEERRGALVAVGTPEQPIRFTEEPGSGAGWNGIAFDGSGQYGENLPSVMEYCVIGHAGADGSAAIDVINHDNVSIGSSTVTASSASGLTCRLGEAAVSDSIFALNAGYGIAAVGSTVTVDYCDVWGNDLGDYGGEAGPGVGCISEDPEFFDWEEGDYELTCASPCIDAGDPDVPPVDGTRLDMGAYQFGGFTAAPEVEPYCEGPLFDVGWVWFSIPLDPDECCGQENCYDPNTLLGFDCGGNLWYFDKYLKAAQVYKPPFLEWNLVPGDSYLLRLGFAPDQVSYIGANPPHPFEFRLGRSGWTWVGMPRGMPMSGEEFMDSVIVKYPSDETGDVRTARDDWSSGDPWVSWGWTFFDTARQAPKAFTPYAPFGNTDCHPWLGYRVWVRAGDAAGEEDPDQVTLVWP